MFVGHYGPALAIRAQRPELPLWLLFLAVQLVDIAWAVLVIAGVEKLRIVPGFTAVNALDLYYMPYTHGLLTAAAWAACAGLLARFAFGRRSWASAAWVAAAVFSHWLVDLAVHRPDLPLYGDSAKVGLGLWNHFLPALLLETLVLLAGLAWYLARSRPRNAVGRHGPWLFAIALLALQWAMPFTPPPPSAAAVASSGLVAYLLFAVVAAALDRQRVPA